MMRAAAALALAAAMLALPGTAVAQSAVPRSSEKAAADCKQGDGKEVVVCGERERSPYRIDPVTLDAMRSEDALKHPDRVARRDPPPADCGVGADICAGGVFPIAQAAEKVVMAVVNAVHGDDWGEPFRTGPDSYDLYRRSKAKKEGISVSVGVRN